MSPYQSFLAVIPFILILNSVCGFPQPFRWLHEWAITHWDLTLESMHSLHHDSYLSTGNTADWLCDMLKCRPYLQILNIKVLCLIPFRSVDSRTMSSALADVPINGLSTTPSYLCHFRSCKRSIYALNCTGDSIQIALSFRNHAQLYLAA